MPDHSYTRQARVLLDYPAGVIGTAYYLSEFLDCDCTEPMEADAVET